MGLTRPEAITQRMDEASVGLEGAIRSLARMLAIVDYEHEEDKRVFGCSRNPARHYVELREAARQAVAEAGGPPVEPRGDVRTNIPTATSIVFRSFNGEPAAIFPHGASAGRIPCFSCRDGHFGARAADIDEWPNAEPTRQLLTELADNFWPD